MSVWLLLDRLHQRNGQTLSELYAQLEWRASNVSDWEVGSPWEHRRRTRPCAGWPAVLAALKSLLETGHVLPQARWEMHAELRAARLAANEAR